MTDEPKIFPLGDGALTIEFGNTISPELNDRALSMARYFTANPFPGLVEAVPAYSSICIFYDVGEVLRRFAEFPTAFEAVCRLVRTALPHTGQTPAENSTRAIEIPVNFGPEAALDIDLISKHSGLSRLDVIDLFVSTTYRVYMLGFLPGFAYMGEVDERITVARRESPRLKVPKGSVGIAGRQTGVYPAESPGGWQIIGRTGLEMFTPDAPMPCLLAAGDKVRFVPAT
jgi:inhibitor of KinA